MDDFTGLLDYVRIASGTSFRSCEPEIIELMRQIDSMIAEKASEWQKQIVALDAELEAKTTENVKLQQHLDTSRKEVKVLQKQLENEKNHNATMMNQYDAEMEKLKSEVNKLKSKFTSKKNSKKTNDDKLELLSEPQDRLSTVTPHEDCTNPEVCCIHKDGANLDARCTDINLIEKSLHNLTACLRETTSCLDKKQSELQMCHAQLESFYFENSILRSFLHQRGIVNFLDSTNAATTRRESVSSFSEHEKERERLLREKIRATIDEFLKNTSPSEV